MQSIGFVLKYLNATWFKNRKTLAATTVVGINLNNPLSEKKKTKIKTNFTEKTIY